MKNKRVYTITIGGTAFNVTRAARSRIRAFLRKIWYTPKLPYDDYSIDMENTLRDILLDLHSSIKKPVSEKEAIKAMSMLELANPPTKWGVIGRVYARFMASAVSPLALWAFLKSYKKLIVTALIAFATIGLGIWLFVLLIMFITTFNVTQQDVTLGGPFYTPILYSPNDTTTSTLYLMSIIVYVSVLLATGIFALIRKKFGKNRLMIIAAATVLYMISWYGISAHSATLSSVPRDYYIAACNGRIQYFDVANMQKGSNEFYALQRNGWRLAGTIPKDATDFNSEVCDQYFSLLSNVANENIMLIPVVFDADNQPKPFYYQASGGDYTEIRYSWFVNEQ